MICGTNLLKFALRSSSAVDNFVFKLCYRWTVCFLVVSSVVVTVRLWAGDSFSCFSDHSLLPLSNINANCYSTVFSVPAKIFKLDGKFTLDSAVEEYRRYQAYYPWVNLFFLVQAFSFYLPHLLWKSYERGYILKLTAGIQDVYEKEENRGLELCYLAKYVLVTQGKHKLYSILYVSFEACNCVVSVVQTVLLVHFFGVTGVPDFMPIKLVTWSDFEKFYFPSYGKCILEFSDDSPFAFCSLHLNRLYMFLFLFIDSWYTLLMILTGMVVVYRVVLLIPAFRAFMTKTSLVEHSVLKSLCHRMSYTDWLFLTRLQKSITDLDFAQLLDKIAIVAQGQEPCLDLGQRSSSFLGLKCFDDSDVISPL